MGQAGDVVEAGYEFVAGGAEVSSASWAMKRGALAIASIRSLGVTSRYALRAVAWRCRGRVTAKTVSASSERTSIAPPCAFAISFAM